MKKPIKSHILSCSIGESIFIGKDISATILTANNGKASLCVKAPKGLDILNEEIYRHTISTRNKSNTL